jgi:hypothetical protein
MKTFKRMLRIGALTVLMAAGIAARAGTIDFSGYSWVVRPSGKGGPGPNNWEPENVFVDANGYLHLKLTKRNNAWFCSEVYTQKRLGMGRYEFWLAGPVDKLDKNVVVGLFNYPTPDVGLDGTHEIDIEFARWGNSSAPIGNYTVWPATNTLRQASKPFSFTLKNDLSAHSFTRSPTNVLFQSYYGQEDEKSHPFATWLYQPPNPAAGVFRKPMPVHINLWCFKGLPPSDGHEMELIIRTFKFTPM